MIVTTFSPQGYLDYGVDFVESYKKHCKYPLTIYVEDDLKIDGADTRNLFEVPGCELFLEAIRSIDYSRFIGMPNNYRMNVNKFCRKVFAMTDFGLKAESDYAFIGADTIFHKDVPEDFLEKMLENVYIAYLGRKGFHSETDFIAFNPEFSAHKMFQSMFIRMYTTGAFQDMKYWCDSDVFDHIRVLLSVPENNINTLDDETTLDTQSVLNEYMTHLKGPLKKQQFIEAKNVNQRRKKVGTV